jgi:O-antigen/teichoic acid export membrane protein
MDYFGAYALLTAFMTIVGMLDFGISRAVILTTYDRELNPDGDYWVSFQVGRRFSKYAALIVSSLGLLSGIVYIAMAHPSLDIAISIGVSALAGALTMLTLPHRAVLEIRNRFLSLNLIRSLMACAVPVAPLLPILSPGINLTSAMLFTLLTRLLGLIAYSGVTREVRRVASPLINDREWSRIFLRRSGFVGLTNLISLAMTYSDRFFLAALASTHVLASYVVAYDTVTKIWLGTSALMSASMPRVAETIFQSSDRTSSHNPQILKLTKLLIVGCAVVPCIIAILLAEPLFRLWLGHSASSEIAILGSILMVGVGINTMTQLNLSLLQLAGGEKQGAYVQVMNLILSVALIFLLFPRWGAVGAAIAVTVRLCCDTVVVRILTSRKTSSRLGFSMVELMVTACILLFGLLY